MFSPRHLLTIAPACAFFFHFTLLLPAERIETFSDLQEFIARVTNKTDKREAARAAGRIGAVARKEPSLFSPKETAQLITQIGQHGKAANCCAKALAELVKSLDLGFLMLHFSPEIVRLCAEHLETRPQQDDCAEILHTLAKRIPDRELKNFFTPEQIAVIAVKMTKLSLKPKDEILKTLNLLAKKLSSEELAARFTPEITLILLALVNTADDAIFTLRLLAQKLPVDKLLQHFTVPVVEELKSHITTESCKGENCLFALAYLAQRFPTENRHAAYTKAALETAAAKKDSPFARNCEKTLQYMRRIAEIPEKVMVPASKAPVSRKRSREEDKPAPAEPKPLLNQKKLALLCELNGKNQTTLLASVFAIKKILTEHRERLTPRDCASLESLLLSQCRDENVSKQFARELLNLLDPDRFAHEVAEGEERLLSSLSCACDQTEISQRLRGLIAS